MYVCESFQSSRLVLMFSCSNRQTLWKLFSMVDVRALCRSLKFFQPTLVKHVLIDLTLCTWAMSCWNRFELGLFGPLKSISYKVILDSCVHYLATFYGRITCGYDCEMSIYMANRKFAELLHVSHGVFKARSFET